MKKILVVATGSVAVIKLKKFISLLKKEFDVKLIASDFAIENYKDIKDMNPISEDSDLLSFPKHIELARWADQIIVIPATTNTISKFCYGIADNFVLSTLIAARQSIIFVPAMNTFMYEALLQRNTIEKLENMGHLFIGPVSGMLREGESGLGRMVEPQDIFNKLFTFMTKKDNGKKVFITYGASKIYIDDVRFITNGSSGKMGKCLKKEFKWNSFDVTAVDISTLTNKQVLEKAINTDFDIYVGAAAFSDFTIEKMDGKYKKNKGNLNLNLTENIDVISELKKVKKDKKFIAFKYDELIENAIDKKNRNNFDMMIWNKLGAMGSAQMSGAIIEDKDISKFDGTTKNDVAKMIVKKVVKWEF